MTKHPLLTRYAVHAVSLNYLYFRGKRELGDLQSCGKISLCQKAARRQLDKGGSFLTEGPDGVFKITMQSRSFFGRIRTTDPGFKSCTSGNKEIF